MVCNIDVHNHFHSKPFKFLIDGDRTSSSAVETCKHMDRTYWISIMFFCYFLFIDYDMKYMDRELMDTQLHHFDRLIRYPPPSAHQHSIFDYHLHLSDFLFWYQHYLWSSDSTYLKNKGSPALLFYLSVSFFLFQRLLLLFCFFNKIILNYYKMNFKV